MANQSISHKTELVQETLVLNRSINLVISHKTELDQETFVLSRSINLVQWKFREKQTPKVCYLWGFMFDIQIIEIKILLMKFSDHSGSFDLLTISLSQTFNDSIG